MRFYKFVVTCGLLAFFSCSKTSFWTSGHNYFSESPPFITEIQITDSTYSEYIGDWGGCFHSNTGSCYIYEANHSGDTLFVYDVNYRPAKSDSNLFVLDTIITMTYLKQRNKLYPIYSDDPKRFYHSLLTNESAYDSTEIKSFKVNWKYWSGNMAYIDFNGGYHSKGKYTDLRTYVKNHNNTSDSIQWRISYPRKVINDTTYVVKEVIDFIGPLKNNGH